MSDMIPESQGDTGVQDSNSAGGNSEPNVDTSISTASNQESNSTGYNPSWDEALSLIPIEEYREQLKPVFEKWDSNNNSRYEKVQQEYAPYRPLIENNVGLDDIQAAFELRNRLAESPQEIFEKLASHLGYSYSKADADGDEESQGQNQYSEEDDDPRFTALQNELAQTKALIQQQAQERIAQEQAVKQEQAEREYYDNTVAELDKLESTYGKFDRNKAVQFAIWEAETNGTDVSLEAGLKAMKAFQGEVLQNSASKNAPDVFSGNGALQSGRVDTSKMSDDEFQKYAVERMKAKLG